MISLTNGGQAIDHETLEWSELGFARLPAGQLWTDSLRGVRITLTHGYESVPIVVEMIREMAARAEASPGGLVEARAGDISEKRSMTAPGVAGGIVLMAHEREQLNPYRIRGS
ncbi:hypothetical protein [Cryobacterium sp. MP_3.1]|uniref:hypothetical protein n=1 Tax=Cryobacterium sp. MP_3.1 TaxID=3071711 RepID=UPI002E0E7993